MAGKKRSGLASHRKAYVWPRSTIEVPIMYTITYNGNTNTSGNVPTDSNVPYSDGSIVTILGNPGTLAKTGYTFSGWNTQANGSGTSYSQGNTITISDNTILYAKWTLTPSTPTPTSLSSVGGNQAAYILFTQSGTITNYEYSTDNGATFLPFNPPQVYSPVEINTLSSDGVTRLTNGTVYTVKLKAVNSGESSLESVSVDVTPTITSLSTTNQIVYLDANNLSSYSGTGNTWTNLASSGAYSATLNGSPTFNTTDEPGNKYFQFNPGAATGQFARINQGADINAVTAQPFTIQMWVRINNIGSQGALVSKVFVDGEGGDYDGYSLYYQSNNTLQLHANGSQINYFTSVAGVLSSVWALYTANINFGGINGGVNKIFVNGRQVMTMTSTNRINYPTKNLTFPTGFGGEGECDIGQFYYYKAQLTTEQIIQNYDATKSKYL
jgi:uncharacterized repeat protein (TIGR02543 family)